LVARFIGSANLVPGRVTETSTPPWVGVHTPLGSLRAVTQHPVRVGDEVLAVLRPEQLTIHAVRPERGDAVEAVLVHRLFAGSTTECVLEAGSLRLRAQVQDAAALRRGAQVFVTVDHAGCVLLPRGTGAPRP